MASPIMLQLRLITRMMIPMLLSRVTKTLTRPGMTTSAVSSVSRYSPRRTSGGIRSRLNTTGRSSNCPRVFVFESSCLVCYSIIFCSYSSRILHTQVYHVNLKSFFREYVYFDRLNIHRILTCFTRKRCLSCHGKKPSLVPMTRLIKSQGRLSRNISSSVGETILTPT